MKETVLGDRVMIQFTNIYEKEDYVNEKGRPAKREVYKDFTREGKVLAKGAGEFSDAIKVGSMVYAMPFGGVEIEKLSNKKHRVVVVPSSDVYLSL